MSSSLDILGRRKQVSLTTFRKDGRAVATAVWHVIDGGQVQLLGPYRCSRTGIGRIDRGFADCQTEPSSGKAPDLSILRICEQYPHRLILVGVETPSGAFFFRKEADRHGASDEEPGKPRRKIRFL